MTAAPDTARDVWLLMSDLVLANTRRREVSEALGMSFGRARAVRLLARQSLSMREFAEAMGIEAPNATVVIDDLEASGLAQRKPHPTDRRAKLVEATRKGRALARQADTILATPPAGLGALEEDELETLRELLERVSAPG
jgi:DNA-binding MarR family transcriptional regulator